MESNVFRILPFLLSLINWIKCGDALPPTQSLYCTDLNPQNHVDIDQVRLIKFQYFFHLLFASILLFHR